MVEATVSDLGLERLQGPGDSGPPHNPLFISLTSTPDLVLI